MKNPNTLQLDFGFDIKPLQESRFKRKNTKKAQDDFVFEFMDCMTSPIIVFRSAWQDAIPKDLLEKITISRMLCLMKGEQKASFTEVVAYMMPRTLESPLQTEWVNIYTWCGLQYANLFNGKEQWSMVSAMKDIAPQQLSEYEMGLLNGLRRWIYDKRRKALKDKLKETKKLKSNKKSTKQKDLF